MKASWSRLALAGFAAVVLAVVVTACGTSSTGGGSAASSGTGAKQGSALQGEGKEIVYFGIEPALSPYAARQNSSMKAEAERLGYKLKVIQSGADQSVQNEQVQQFVSSGQKPAGFLIFPLNGEVGMASTRLLSQIAPVVQVNSLPKSSQEREYIVSFCCQTDKVVGENMGKQMIAVRKAVLESGRELHSEGGNVVYLGPIAGLSGGEVRKTAALGIIQAQKPAFNIIADESIEDNSTQGTYEKMVQLIPQLKSKGIDFVLAENGDMALGAIEALKQNGLTPGKDVSIVAGDCSQGGQGVKQLENGEIAAMTVESPNIEGRLALQTLGQYIATGEVKPGEYSASQSPDALPTPKVEPAHEDTFMPAVGVDGKGSANKVKIWGESIGELCPES